MSKFEEELIDLIHKWIDAGDNPEEMAEALEMQLMALREQQDGGDQ